ncbi:MAG TPA: hypothetical protein VMV49_01475 [Candidatus Deferrimicrobium sp.]|nr:hypothetical protein [Candidatus Deferrimicrobium sp.]
MAEFESIIKRVIIALEKSQLKYVIVGGFAAIFRGRPRTTTDIDMIVENNIQKINRFLEVLKTVDFEVMENQVKTAINEGSNLSFFDKLSVLRIDFKVAKKLDENEVLEQAKLEHYKGIKIQLASIEQILYGKILYLGDISDLPDSELLENTDVLYFISVFRRAKIVDLIWLTSKVKQKGLESTLKRLLKFIKTFQ